MSTYTNTVKNLNSPASIFITDTNVSVFKSMMSSDISSSQSLQTIRLLIGKNYRIHNGWRSKCVLIVQAPRQGYTTAQFTGHPVLLAVLMSSFPATYAVSLLIEHPTTLPTDDGRVYHTPCRGGSLYRSSLLASQCAGQLDTNI